MCWFKLIQQFIMLSKSDIYDYLKSIGNYLPPRSDGSLTSQIILGILDFTYTCLWNDQVFPVDIKPKASRKSLLIAIKELTTTLERPLWFFNSRLPCKQYLVDILFALDPMHPLLSKEGKYNEPRILRFNGDCSRCKRKFYNDNRKTSMNQLKNRKKDSRPPLKPVGLKDIDIMDLNIRARQIVKSRYGVVAIRRGTKIDLLKDYEFNKLSVQARIQNEIGYIDNIIDQIEKFK